MDTFNKAVSIRKITNEHGGFRLKIYSEDRCREFYLVCLDDRLPSCQVFITLNNLTEMSKVSHQYSFNIDKESFDEVKCEIDKSNNDNIKNIMDYLIKVASKLPATLKG